MPRTKRVICETEESLVLLVYYNPTAKGNHAYVMGLPPDLTNTEKRDMLEMALTVINNDIAKELISIVPDESPPDAADVIATARADMAQTEADQGVDDTAPIVELTREPIEETLAAPSLGNGHLVAPVLPPLRRRVQSNGNSQKPPSSTSKNKANKGKH